MKYPLLISCLALSTLPLQASAQTAPASPYSLTVGGAVGIGPRFPGSKKNQFGVGPLLDLQHESGFFASTRRGLGWGGGDQDFSFSLALAARGGRSDKTHKFLGLGGGGSELAGMGKVPASALGVFSVGGRLANLVDLGATLELPLTHRENGRALHLSAGLPLLQAKADTVTLSGGLHVGDSKYLRTYFGVTQPQSTASGYAVYTPKSGVYQTDLNLSWNHRFDSHWAITGMAGVNHLMGDAGKSPLAGRKTAPEGGLMVSYTY